MIIKGDVSRTDNPVETQKIWKMGGLFFFSGSAAPFISRVVYLLQYVLVKRKAQIKGVNGEENTGKAKALLLELKDD